MERTAKVKEALWGKEAIRLALEVKLPQIHSFSDPRMHEVDLQAEIEKYYKSTNKMKRRGSTGLKRVARRKLS